MTIRRGYSEGQMRDMSFSGGDYHFPTGGGEFIGILAMKKWTGENALVCYFDAEDGSKYKLCVWFSYNTNRTYRPAESDLDISHVEIGSKLRVVYGPNSKGNAKWLDAEVLRA